MLNSSTTMHTKKVFVLTIDVCILLTTTSTLILGYQIAEAAAEQQQQQEKFFMVMKLQKNSDSYYQVSNMTTNMKNFNQGNNKVEYILEMSPCS
jgi:CMP-N-acetylneuraminic acid synthetase